MIGFDIGGTKCAVCIGEEKEGVLFVRDKRVISTDHSISPYEMIDKMCALAEEMTDKIDVIGISCGGPLDSKRGIIMSPPNLPGWDDIKIVDYIKEKYNSARYSGNYTAEIGASYRSIDIKNYIAEGKKHYGR